MVSLVTSRRRLAPHGDATDLLKRQIESAVRARVDLIQIREPDLSDRASVSLVRWAVDVARGTRSLILVNERFDVALSAGAAGVHLRSSSVPAPVMRDHLPPGFLVGRSVHAAGEAARVAAAGGVDFLTLGTVYPSASKPGRPPCGVDVLAAAARAVRLPILAIGGVTVDKAIEVLAAGAAGTAAIGLFAEPGPAGTFDSISAIAAEIRRCSERH